MSKKVFIGVGHGGKDSGAVKYIVEKEYTLKTAQVVAEYLKARGVEYKLSRTADIDTDMNSKVKGECAAVQYLSKVEKDFPDIASEYFNMKWNDFNEVSSHMDGSKTETSS